MQTAGIWIMKLGGVQTNKPKQVQIKQSTLAPFI